MTDNIHIEFNKYIEYHKLLAYDTTVLVATSGGVDSMVLLDLFGKSKYKISVAHINHNLRGEDSMQDEKFVEDYCKKHNIPFHLRSVDVAGLATAAKANMHEYARNMRYQFFQELCDQNQYGAIATAHHKDDKIEGYFLNLMRGAGLNGLKGIQPSRNNIIHPLLFLFKEDIHNYASQHNICYREDLSNASTKYSRNYIRHKLAPVLKQVNANYQQSLNRSIDQLSDSHKLLQYYISNNTEQYCTIEGNTTTINLEMIIEIPGNNTLLYYWINKFNFSTSQVEDIILAVNNTGARFESTTHKAIIDRKKLVIKRSHNDSNMLQLIQYQLDIGEQIVIPNFGVVNIVNLTNPALEPLTNMAVLDQSKLVFPLIIRKWQPGDRFYPSGMQGKSKKLKKYLTDIKLNLFEKENTYVLLSNNEICWVIGHRIDHRFEGKDILIKLTDHKE